MGSRLTDRDTRVLELRRSGLTFKDIARALGVSYSRARDLYHRAELREKQDASDDPFDQIPSVRTAHALLGAGAKTKDDVRRLVDGALPGDVAGLGEGGLREVREWLGMDSLPSKRRWRFTAEDVSLLRELAADIEATPDGDGVDPFRRLRLEQLADRIERLV
jgi:hypothetical protein